MLRCSSFGLLRRPRCSCSCTRPARRVRRASPIRLTDFVRCHVRVPRRPFSCVDQHRAQAQHPPRISQEGTRRSCYRRHRAEEMRVRTRPFKVKRRMPPSSTISISNVFVSDVLRRPGRSDIPILARHRRVRHAGPTRLPDSHPKRFRIRRHKLVTSCARILPH
jgi:hypothetical protein